MHKNALGRDVSLSLYRGLVGLPWRVGSITGFFKRKVRLRFNGDVVYGDSDVSSLCTGTLITLLDGDSFEGYFERENK